MGSLYSNQYRNLKLASQPWGGDSGGVKRTRRDEPVGAIIHICIETPGNS
jgi:hypothetical protein